MSKHGLIGTALLTGRQQGLRLAFCWDGITLVLMAGAAGCLLAGLGPQTAVVMERLQLSWCVVQGLMLDSEIIRS